MGSCCSSSVSFPPLDFAWDVEDEVKSDAEVLEVEDQVVSREFQVQQLGVRSQRSSTCVHVLSNPGLKGDIEEEGEGEGEGRGEREKIV
jgi:hypothetical protein